MKMFSIKWVAHGDDRKPVKIERDMVRDLDEIVASGIERLPSMRMAYPEMPPRGFLVLDGHGNEVCRWFESLKALSGPSGRKTRYTTTRRALVIEDDESVQLAINYSLSRAGYVVEQAPNGPYAFENCNTSEFDVVIVDIFMPDMDGIEVIKLLRKQSPAVPIIAMTGHIYRKTRVDFLEIATKMGANVRLSKPFGPCQLMDAVKMCADKECLSQLSPWI